MSSIVTIKAEQLPEALRPALKEYEEAQLAAGEARRALNVAPVADKHSLKPAVDKAVADAQAAHTALLEATRAQPSAIRDHSNAAFAACVERAREHLAQAEAELRAAAGHAAVWGSVRPGRPTVNIERGDQTPGRLRAMFAVGQVREAVEALPEDVE